MSFIAQVEASIEEVADWGANLIDRAIKALSPDGRPFLYSEQSEGEQIVEYMALRGNPEAWAKWIGDTAGEIFMKLQESAVPPDEIMAVHPVDIAMKMAIEHSYTMETMMAKKAGKLNLNPTIPEVEVPYTPLTPMEPEPMATPAAPLLTGVV